MCAVTLFDLDGVLTRGDTMARLVTRRLCGHPARAVWAVPLFILSMAAAPDSSWRARLNRRLVALALKGLSEEEYGKLASSLGPELAATPDFVSKQAVLECTMAAASTRTIVVTASERVLARAFLDAIGLGNIELQSSELRFHDRTTTFAHHNVGPGKLANLQSESVNLGQAVLYTDSATDLPLAQAVGKTILINPGRRSRRKFRAVHTAAEVRHWSKP